MSKAPLGAHVAVLGASPKPERYSYQAVKMLSENGYTPIPVHPAGHTVFDHHGVKSLADIETSVDTLTVYVNAKISSDQADEILALKPRRVVFNPGAENDELAGKLSQNGIEVVKACTLVMLRTGQF